MSVTLRASRRYRPYLLTHSFIPVPRAHVRDLLTSGVASLSCPPSPAEPPRDRTRASCHAARCARGATAASWRPRSRVPGAWRLRSRPWPRAAVAQRSPSPSPTPTPTPSPPRDPRRASQPPSMSLAGVLAFQHRASQPKANCPWQLAPHGSGLGVWC